MINAKNIVNKLKEHLELRTDEQLSDYLGVHFSTLSGWKKRNSINIELIMEKVKDIDMNWLLYDDNVENTNDYSKVKLKHFQVDDDNVEYMADEITENLLNVEVYDVPAYMSEDGLVNLDEYPQSTRKLYLGMEIDPKRVKSIRVQGRSMEGSGINPNDMVFFRTDDKVYNNRQVLANLNGALIVKTLRKENGKIILYSEYAHETKPIEVGDDDHLNIIGTVIAVLSYR